MLLLACALALRAGEAPVQPLLLPMEHLLKHLDQAQEWMLVPLADYRALVATATPPGQPSTMLGGARITCATITGTLSDDRVLALQGTLELETQGRGPQRCRLFLVRPARLGAVTCDGRPAVLVGDGAALDVLVPGSGSHRVTVGWGVDLDGDDRRRQAALPLPLAGAVALTIDAGSAGSFSGDALVADPAAPGRWRLVRGAGPQVALAWEPGRSGSATGAVFGVDQVVQAEIADGPAPLRWAVHLVARRGEAPERLEVTLPAGWRLTQAASPGVVALSDLADGRVRVQLAAGSTGFACDGLRAAGAAIALPSISGAAYQGGVVMVRGQRPFDLPAPPSWRRLEDADGLHRFAVPVPGAGAVPVLGETRWGLDVRSSTSVELTDGKRPWGMVQTIELADQGSELGEVALQVPAGWQVQTLAANHPLRIRQLAGGGEVADLPPGALLTLVPQAAQVRALTVTLTLTRADAGVGAVVPVLVRGNRRSAHRLSLLTSAPIATRIDAGPSWRMGAVDAPVLANGTLRAELFATGEPAPVRVETRRLEAEVGAEAVLYLAPGLRDDHWCRLDLRLRVRAGEIEALTLDAPLLRDQRLQVISSVFSREERADGLELRARVPLVGDHLLRLEGALDPARLGTLPRVVLNIGGQAVAVRQVVVVQAPPQADLVLSPGTGAVALPGDALPAWSRSLPGLPVSAAWRLGDGEAGGYRLERRELAAAPAGFIDQVVAHSQIDRAGTMTVLTARVAAPTVQALPLVVPPGMTLLQASVDGQEVAVRRTAGGNELPLPGRTQVQVALLFSGPALAAAGTGWDLDLPLPRLGDLPATATSWSVSVASGFHVAVRTGPGSMPLTSDQPAAGRPWFGTWWEAAAEHQVPALPALHVDPGQPDARALAQQQEAAQAQGEPQLIRHGHHLAGTRLGGETALQVHLIALATLRAFDHLGWVLAVLSAVALTWCSGLRLRLALGLAGWLLALALHGWQAGVGPLLAWCEWLAPALAAGGALWWLVRLRPAPGTPAALAALLLLALAMTGGDAGAAETPLLMGYQRLDPKGVPQEVRVALTRAQLTQLWQRAHAAPPAAAVCDLATGTPRYALRFADGHLLGTLALAIAVPGASWQQVRVPMPVGAVRGVSARALAGVDPGTVAWSSEASGTLVLTLAPQQQADVVIDLDLAATQAAGVWTTTLPLPAIPGGSLAVESGEGWVPWLGERQLVRAGTLWTCDLPLQQAEVTVSLRHPPAAVVRELHLGVEQRLHLALHHDRLEWSATLVCTTQGGGLRRLALTVPAGLVLTAIAGDGVAAWSQHGTQAEVVATSERSGSWTMQLAGVLAVAAGDERERAVVLRVDGAERMSGRLDLRAGAGLRFERPGATTVERVDPLPGDDQAVRWGADPGAISVRWRAQDDDLTADLRATLRIGADRVRVRAALDLSGPGQRDALRLRIPAPWQVVGLPADVELVWHEAAGIRECALRTATPWQAGASLVLQLEAERAALGAHLQAPDLRPDGGIAAGRQVWLFAGAGDRKVRLEDHERQQAMTLDAALAACAKLAALDPGERWLQACSWRGDGAPRLEVAAEEAVVKVRASHYLVLAQDRVRWWAHLVHQVEQGELTTLRCTLPAAARLARVSADGLGSWQQDGRELSVVLAGPTRQAVALDLELELPLSAQAVTLEALGIPGSSGPQDVALVEEDDLGLVQLDAQGLDALGERVVPFSIPQGIDVAAIRHRWRSLRPQWTLAIRREALASGRAIGDNVVTLVDAVSVLGVDGECRGRAVWQVLNRSRTQLTVRLPPGLELWEARVAGLDVRPRQGANPGEVVLPVTPQRPGESTQAITLTWRERLDPGRTISPGLPQFTDLRIMQGLWRVVPPPGFVLTRKGGTMLPVEVVVAEACRAQSVIDELKRLRGLGDLDDVGLKRLNDQLVTLDLQLSDNLVSLQQVGGKEAQSLQQQSYNAQVINDVNGNRSELQEELKRIDSVRSARGERRSKLGLDNARQTWTRDAAAAAPAGGTYAPRAALAVKPRQLVPLAPDATLGAGQPPPGQRADEQRALLGLDLLGDPGTGGLALRAQSNDLRLELTMRREGGEIGPWLAALAAALVLVVGVWFGRGK